VTSSGVILLLGNTDSTIEFMLFGPFLNVFLLSKNEVFCFPIFGFSGEELSLLNSSYTGSNNFIVSYLDIFVFGYTFLLNGSRLPGVIRYVFGVILY